MEVLPGELLREEFEPCLIQGQALVEEGVQLVLEEAVVGELLDGCAVFLGVPGSLVVRGVALVVIGVLLHLATPVVSEGVAWMLCGSEVETIFGFLSLVWLSGCCSVMKNL